VLAAFFAALSWGLYSNLGRFVPMKPQWRGDPVADVQTWLAMSFGLVMMAVRLLLQGGVSPPTGHVTQLYFAGWGPIPTDAWHVVTVLGVAVYLGGFTLWLVALERARKEGEAHRLPPLTYLVPVLSVALGWLVLRESFGPGFWQGAALIAAGNLIIAVSRGWGKQG
jgi:drug/metabolite transporter (DMT)-like permease